MQDHELLQEYVRSRSQEAFRQLVERHLGMVYSAALRMVGNAQLAEDVAQGVFTTLAEKSHVVTRSSVLGGWLYTTTRHFALHAVRTEQRRRQREQEAVVMQTIENHEDSGPIFEQLEAAMNELESQERDALVLRFLEDRNLREVGLELGISEDAARMRVNRALERLRTVFSSKGVAVSSVVLGTVLASSSSTALPVGLASTITVSAVIGTAAATHFTLLTIMNAKIMAAALGAAVLAGIGTYWVQQQGIQAMRAENAGLRASQSKLAADQEAAATVVQAQKEELDRMKKGDAELLRLRNEVSQLRRERETQKTVLSQAPSTASRPEKGGHTPGQYILKDELAIVGYATPEAALETLTYAMFLGTYDQANQSVTPEKWKETEGSSFAREGFESTQKDLKPLFQGVQILAKKTTGEDNVELKVKVNAGPWPEGVVHPPSVMIYPMQKVGDSWKLAGSTPAYTSKWDEDGQIQTFAQ